ncbi:hypothetical protein FVEG_16498 [Fusarium verticillioides 7600]|uniref:Uncharacterized protein n=1 Tax=Gibberella moniliformis (strain M3125 / FGSC 7600) TaxID=334819 RepID=W7MYQ9_GIBM7|nr:hypothetical protein FVEG_16498 [Fusarium verticillioides 7600]EWG49507.1 hypothetical protein FVEG_16498 [Fusarium verticillioides 7600]
MISAYNMFVSLAVRGLSKQDSNGPLVFFFIISLDSLHALHMPLSFPFFSYSFIASPLCLMHRTYSVSRMKVSVDLPIGLESGPLDEWSSPKWYTWTVWRG